jgi:hypothetical protein
MISFLLEKSFVLECNKYAIPQYRKGNIPNIPFVKTSSRKPTPTMNIFGMICLEISMKNSGIIVNGMRYGPII